MGLLLGMVGSHFSPLCCGHCVTAWGQQRAFLLTRASCGLTWGLPLTHQEGTLAAREMCGDTFRGP